MYDVIIVGGGPGGLTAAIYLLRSKKKVLVLEKEVFGGQITKASKVENYPGFVSISGMELGEKMKEQASLLGMESEYDEAVKIECHDDMFIVTGKTKNYHSKSVIWAAGTSPRKLELSNEQTLIGKGISYCATCDGAFFKDKVVCVVGGGNTAISDALYLSNICKKVYLIHRKDNFRAEPIHVQLLKEKENVEFLYYAQVVGIIGDDKVEKVKIMENDDLRELVVDGVFVAIGKTPNTRILKDFVPLNPNGFIKTNYQLETQIPGFYVVGDVREKKIRQLTTAVSDGTIAAIEVGNFLDQL